MKLKPLCAAAALLIAAMSGHAMPDTCQLPDGHRAVAACTPGGSLESGGAGPRISLVSGATVGDTAFSGTPLTFSVTGLKPGPEYVLALSWNGDPKSRQSVRFGVGEPPAWTSVLPATVPCAFHADQPVPARFVLPIPAEYTNKGAFQVVVAAESGLPASVAGLWLMERTEPAKAARVLLVTGDDYVGHRWRETTPEIAALLREDPRFEVSISECPAMLGSPLLDHYDAVVLHFKNYEERLPLGAEVGEGLARYAAAGHGVVLTHFTCGAFQEWPGFEEVAGRVWNPKFRAHDPHGEFQVTVLDREHPVTAGMEDFSTLDELYTCLDGDTPIHVLCGAVSKVDQKQYPMAFILDTPDRRVFHCVLGHDPAAFSAQGVRDLYRRATAWAAGLEPNLP